MVLFNATGGPRGDKEDLGQKVLELELVEFGNISIYGEIWRVMARLARYGELWRVMATLSFVNLPHRQRKRNDLNGFVTTSPRV